MGCPWDVKVAETRCIVAHTLKLALCYRLPTGSTVFISSLIANVHTPLSTPPVLFIYCPPCFAGSRVISKVFGAPCRCCRVRLGLNPARSHSTRIPSEVASVYSPAGKQV